MIADPPAHIGAGIDCLEQCSWIEHFGNADHRDLERLAAHFMVGVQ